MNDSFWANGNMAGVHLEKQVINCEDCKSEVDDSNKYECFVCNHFKK